MAKRSSKAANAAEREDVKHILGDLDEAKIIQILELNPSLADLEEAAARATGDADILAKGGHSPSGIATAIVEIVVADEEEEEPRSTR